MSFVFDDAGACRFERADDADAARWHFSQFEVGADHVLALARACARGRRCAALEVTLREFRAAG